MNISIITEKGKIYIDLFPDVKIVCANFLKYAEMGYYNNTSFHRVENFCIQAGVGNPIFNHIKPENIKHEITHHRFGQYTLGMADAGIGTASTQFFITKCECPNFNGRYIVFGQVILGNSIVWKIEKGSKIYKIVRG